MSISEIEAMRVRENFLYEDIFYNEISSHEGFL